MHLYIIASARLSDLVDMLRGGDMIRKQLLFHYEPNTQTNNGPPDFSVSVNCHSPSLKKLVCAFFDFNTNPF